MTQLQKMLMDLKDEKYALFQAKLLPGINPETIIGVRVPVLRKFAKTFWQSAMISGNDDVLIDFLNGAPHEFYEENLLHMLFISELRDFDDALYCLEEFLPFVDNWAVCDMCHPKVLSKQSEKVFEKIKIWVSSDYPYTVRYGIGLLMANYLDENFNVEHLELVSKIKSSEYYVNMMIAWYFATALAKQWESTIPVIEKGVMEKWTHNKTIQKAIESFRISDEKKEYLRTLKKK